MIIKGIAMKKYDVQKLKRLGIFEQKPIFNLCIML